MDSTKLLSPVKPIHKHEAISRTIDEMVADGESRKRTAALFGYDFRSQPQNNIHKAAVNRFNVKDKYVQKSFIIARSLPTNIPN